MAKSRLYEFAKALGLESKEVIAIASACGLERRISPSSTLNEEEKAKILSFIQDRRAPKQAEHVSAVVIRKARETKPPETLIEGPQGEPSSEESLPAPEEAAIQSASLPEDKDVGVWSTKEAEPSLEVEPGAAVEGEEAAPNEALVKEELSIHIAVPQEPEAESQTKQVMEEPKEAEVPNRKAGTGKGRREEEGEVGRS